jgi:all-trans-retinol 13,14-reductase
MEKNNAGRKNYSLIVVGGGITGLSTALTWAKNNNTSKKPVLLIEKEPSPGGYVTSFKREGFLFDIVQIIPDSTDVLEYFGVALELKKFEGYYARIFLADSDTKKTKVINIPSGFDEFRNFLLQEYPSQAKQINRFCSYSGSMFDELIHLKTEPKFIELFKILIQCPKIIANSNNTFLQYISRFGFTDSELLEIFDVFAAFSGLPAERVAALLAVSAMIASMKGSFRPHKGFIEFPNHLKRRLIELGGEVMTKTKVVRIITENLKAKGVELENGELIFADHIVTTIDPKVAMMELVGIETIRKASARYAKKVETVRMSPSALLINLGLDDKINLKELGFDCGYNLLTTGKGTYNKLFEAYDRNELLMSDDCFYIPAICSSLTTGGKQSLTIIVYPVAIGNWKELRESDYNAYTEKKNKTATFFINKVEQYMIPGLKKHILFTDIATPATFSRFSGSPTGSKFDMAPYCDNFGRTRLTMRTPIRNLYQPKFSNGIWPSLQAGIQVVDMIMNRKVMDGNARYAK